MKIVFAVLGFVAIFWGGALFFELPAEHRQTWGRFILWGLYFQLLLAGWITYVVKKYSRGGGSGTPS